MNKIEKVKYDIAEGKHIAELAADWKMSVKSFVRWLKNNPEIEQAILDGKQLQYKNMLDDYRDRWLL